MTNRQQKFKAARAAGDSRGQAALDRRTIAQRQPGGRDAAPPPVPPATADRSRSAVERRGLVSRRAGARRPNERRSAPLFAAQSGAFSGWTPRKSSKFDKDGARAGGPFKDIAAGRQSTPVLTPRSGALSGSTPRKVWNFGRARADSGAALRRSPAAESAHA